MRHHRTLLFCIAVFAACESEPPTVPNRAPTAGQIPLQTVHVGERRSLDLSGYFTDPDGDALTFTAESGHPDLVSVSVSGSTLELAADRTAGPRSPGPPGGRKRCGGGQRQGESGTGLPGVPVGAWPLPGSATAVRDRSRAAGLRRAVRAVFGPTCFLQRCRATARRAVLEELRRERRAGKNTGDQDKELPEADEVRERIRLAYEAGADSGMRELHDLASQLDGQGAGAAARALRTSPANLFTVDRLGLRPPLSRALSTTHVVMRAPWHLPQRICNPPSWRDAEMALQWTVASFLESEKVSPSIQGVRQLPALTARLDGGPSPG